MEPQRRPKRAAKLRQVLHELLACYDEMAALGTDTAERDAVHNRVAELEARTVALVRPRRWRFRDLKTAGIRDLSAVGVAMTDGKLRYGEHVWPAAWSYARIEPGESPEMRTLSIGRVVGRSLIPLRKSVDPDLWTAPVSAVHLPDALILAACINVSSRMRAATFPVGTYF